MMKFLNVFPFLCSLRNFIQYDRLIHRIPTLFLYVGKSIASGIFLLFSPLIFIDLMGFL